jgi:hypothetical protein
MWLLYCVFQTKIAEVDVPQGVEGNPVMVVCSNGLGAAVSEISPSALSPTIRMLAAYERVVEAFHRHHAVIPMRYGSTCETRGQALQLLKDRGEEYRALLDKLGDCIEMGIRVLLPPAPRRTGSPGDAAVAGVSPSGRAYLAAQRERYATQNRAAAEQERLVEAIRTSLGGLFVHSRSESSSCYGGRLVSLYFLLPRNRVEPLRQAFRDLSVSDSAKLLLTGPWPPYNFVLANGNQKEEGGYESEG